MTIDNTAQNMRMSLCGRTSPAASRKEVRRLVVFLKKLGLWFRLKFEFAAGFNDRPE
jgi:hypothetical protein